MTRRDDVIGEIDEVAARILERHRERLEEARQEMRRLARQLTPDGVVPYRSEEGRWLLVEKPQPDGRPGHPDEVDEAGMDPEAKAETGADDGD